MSIDEIHPLFGRVAPEWLSPPPQTTAPAPFLYYVHGGGNDRSALRVIATDFHSNTFQAIKSRHQLEDLVSFEFFFHPLYFFFHALKSYHLLHARLVVMVMVPNNWFQV